MKKAFSLLLALALMLTALVPAVFAEESRISGEAVYSETEKDISLDISFLSVQGEDFEEVRQKTYLEARKKYSDAQIAADPLSSWMLFETTVMCRITLGEKVYDVKAVPVSQRSMSLSLFGDILPCLEKNGAYTTELQEGFDYTLSLHCVAHYNGRYLSLFSDSVILGTYHAPATSYIEYDLPFEADNRNNPVFLFYPFEADIVLAYPTRPGYTFAGWVNVQGIAIDRIPTGTRRIKIGAGWTPKSFGLFYILNTRYEYEFTKCKNPNPFGFSSDTGLLLFNPTAPSGWVFAGWFENPELSGEPVTRILPGTEHDVVLYAKWRTEDELLDERIKSEGWCDVNDDGKITAADARLTLRAAVGLDRLSPKLFDRVDFENNNTISAATARTVLRVSVGLDSMRDVLRRFGLA